MKKILLIITGILLGTVLTYAQDISQAQVPSIVLNTFKVEFPEATDVEWEQQGNQYEVDFDLSRAGHELWLDSTGKILKHKEDITRKQLPEDITNTLKSRYANYRVSDIHKIQTGNVVEYDLDVQSGQEEWELRLSADGKVLEKKID